MGKIVLRIFISFLMIVYLTCSGQVIYPEESNLFGKYKNYNVLLVSFDAGRAKSVSCYGCPRLTTPNLDKLAKDGILFKEAISPAPWTLPATMSIFTGLYPSSHKVLNKYTVTGPDSFVETVLSKDIKTIPELLKENGYILAGFTGDAGVGGAFGYNRGFEVYLDKVKFGGFDQSIPAALEWLKTKNQQPATKDKPFFMFLHGYDAHGQYDPPAGYTREFVKSYQGLLQGGKVEQGTFREQGLDQMAKSAAGGQPPYITMTPADVDFYTSLYEEKIKDADERFAQFLDEFTKMGLRENTIIIITADHGEEFYEHGYLDHGPTLYEELVHVPLIMILPDKSSSKAGVGKVISEPVSTIDIMPTVMELLGYENPLKNKPVAVGISLLPLLRGEKIPTRDIFCETDYRLVTFKRCLRTVHDGNKYKFIYTLENDGKELYNLDNDPEEKNNLIAAGDQAPVKFRRIAYELEQKLWKHLKDMETDFQFYRTFSGERIKVY